MLYVTVNGYGNVETLPPIYGTFAQNEDVMTSNKCLKHNHPTMSQKALEKKVQVGKDQEKAQSEKDSHSKNRGGTKTN